MARGGNLLLGAGLLLLGGGVVGLAVAANAAMLAGTAFAYRRLRAAVAPIWRPDWAYWRRQAAQQLPIGLGILCSMLAFRVDMLLIPAVAGRAALGVYSVAYKLFEPALIVPGVVLAATFPLLARRGAGGADAAGAVLAPTLGLLGGLGAAAAAGLALLAGPIVGLLYGAPYAAAAPVLAALAPALLPLFLNYGLTHALIALDRTRAYAALMFAALVANLALNLALLPALGLLGAALATGATEVVVLAGCVLALGRGARRAVAAPAAEPGWEAGL